MLYKYKFVWFLKQTNYEHNFATTEAKKALWWAEHGSAHLPLQRPGAWEECKFTVSLGCTATSCLTKQTQQAGEMALAEDLDSAPSTHMLFTTAFNSSPRASGVSSDLPGHQACTRCTDKHAGKKLTCIKQATLLLKMQSKRKDNINELPKVIHPASDQWSVGRTGNVLILA